MISKEEVESLIKSLKKTTGKSLGQLSTAVGWSKPTTLTEMKSKGKYEEVYDRLNEYKLSLEDTTKRQHLSIYEGQTVPLSELLSRMDRHTSYLEGIIDKSLLNIGASLTLIKEKILNEEQVPDEQKGSSGVVSKDRVANTSKDKGVTVKRDSVSRRSTSRKV